MKNKENKEKYNIGGNALDNGIILKSEKRETITKISEDGKITVRVKNYFTNKKDNFSIVNLPFIRGIYNIASQLITSKDDLKDSIKYICRGLNIKYEDEEIEFNIPFLIFVIITLLILLFVIIPIIISIPFKSMQNIIQVLIQLLLFTIILMCLKFNKNTKEILEYHAVEHKIVNAYEKLNLEGITIENVKKESRIHRRCGTNFISFFILINIIEMLFLPISNLFIKMGIMSLAMILNMSVAYELVVLLSILPKWLSYLFYPVMAIQFFTTNKPSNDKIKVGIYGLIALIKDDLSLSVYEFIQRYKFENTKDIDEKDYTLQDMLKIIAYVTNKSVNNIYISLNEYMLNYNEQIEITRLLNLLFKEYVPLQYIIKRTYFYNEEYIVNNNVLIPRQDTEILVEKAIEYINKYELKEMIDLCTGSGCIGISVANNSNIEKVILSDVSKEALNVARKNIELNNVSSKVKEYHSDLLKLYIKDNILTDIIVSNPPYIKTNVIKTLDKKVKKEPYIALDGGKTGLDMYIRILNEATKVLKDDGYLMFEIGYDQLKDIKSIAAAYSEYEFIESVKDFGDNDRVVIYKFHQNKH